MPVSSLAGARWLLKTSVTGCYAKELEYKFICLTDDALGNFASNLHRMDAIRTPIWAGRRHNSTWLVCSTCAEHFILLFRVRLYQDDPNMELSPTFTSMLLVVRIRDSHSIDNRILHDGNATDGTTNTGVGKLVDVVDKLKRSTISVRAAGRNSYSSLVPADCPRSVPNWSWWLKKYPQYPVQRQTAKYRAFLSH